MTESKVEESHLKLLSQILVLNGGFFFWHVSLGEPGSQPSWTRKKHVFDTKKTCTIHEILGCLIGILITL